MDAITKPKRKASATAAPGRGYPDLHDHIARWKRPAC